MGKKRKRGRGGIKSSDSESSQVIDLTSDNASTANKGPRRSKRLRLSRKTKKPTNRSPPSSLSNLETPQTKEFILTDKESSISDVEEKKRKKKKKKSKSVNGSWCSLSIDFADDVDSNLSAFDVSFVPIVKENVANWKKPFVDTLKVNERLNYVEFGKQSGFADWIGKEKKTLPVNIGLFKCEQSRLSYQTSPGKTKTSSCVAVNKLLNERN